ncbi:PIN domain-containing protein [Caldisericum sp.]|uniref:PIN domain-containing protein n=1 Tax=Caldisericum sp. TaxID=2499687 RepID=UPI003D10ADBD
MYLIDTNIFIEILLKENKHTECVKFLKSVQRNNIETYFSRFSLYSIELIMRLKLLEQTSSTLTTKFEIMIKVY